MAFWDWSPWAVDLRPGWQTPQLWCWQNCLEEQGSSTWGSTHSPVRPVPTDRNSQQLDSPIAPCKSLLWELQPEFQPRMKQWGLVEPISPSGVLGENISPPSRHSAVISTNHCETLTYFSGPALSRFGEEVTVSLQPLVTKHLTWIFLTSTWKWVLNLSRPLQGPSNCPYPGVHFAS